MKPWVRWEDWINAVAGAWLFIVPSAMRYLRVAESAGNELPEGPG